MRESGLQRRAILWECSTLRVGMLDGFGFPCSQHTETVERRREGPTVVTPVVPNVPRVYDGLHLRGTATRSYPQLPLYRALHTVGGLMTPNNTLRLGALAIR